MDLADDLNALLDALGQANVPHMLVGALALDALGVPRNTFDVDLQIALDETPPIEQSRFLGWEIEEHALDRVFDQPTLILRAPVSPIPFELFITRHWFARQALAQRIPVHSELLERDVPIPTPEDFILLKLAHMVHPSRSKRKAVQDGLDIEGVVLAQDGELDVDYLRAHAGRLGLAQEIEEFVAAT